MSGTNDVAALALAFGLGVSLPLLYWTAQQCRQAHARWQTQMAVQSCVTGLSAVASIFNGVASLMSFDETSINNVRLASLSHDLAQQRVRSATDGSTTRAATAGVREF